VCFSHWNLTTTDTFKTKWVVSFLPLQTKKKHTVYFFPDHNIKGLLFPSQKRLGLFPKKAHTPSKNDTGPSARARGTRAFGSLRTHTEFCTQKQPGFRVGGDGSLPSPLRPIPATARSRGLPQPGECHILENAKSWKTPNLGKCQILHDATSWMLLTNPGDCHMLDTAKSW